MFVGIGVGIGRQRFMGSFSDAYVARVTADGGIVESIQCVATASTLLQSASLLLIPSGFKEGKLYAENPVNGNGDLTWSRASDAWRTNASGLVQRTPWNLATYSEDFTNSAWTTNGINITTSANTTIAPNGTTTADSILANTTNDLHYVQQRTGSATAGVTYTISCYVKNLGYDYCSIQTSNTGTAIGTFRFSTKTLSISGANVVANSGVVEELSNGWFRISLSVLAPASATWRWSINILNDSASVSFAGDGTKGLYVWGFQFVEGSSAQTYFPTTDRLNVPRLSYMYGSCPAVLLEPQRTNLALYSEQFNTLWGLSSANVSSNTTTAPDGNLTADTITTTSINNIIAQQINVLANTTYTFSFWALRGTMTDLKYSVYNLSTPSNIIAPTSYYSQTNSSTWSRISVTFTTPSGCTSINIYPIRDTGVTGTVYLWGAQLEAGAYPTTYIQTTSASATRVADAFTRNNIYTNGLISSSGGTWFVELRGNLSYTRDASSNSLFLGDTTLGSSNAFVFLAGTGTNRLYLFKVVSGAFSQLVATSTDTVKIAIKWNGSTADVFANGTKVVSATTFTATQLQNLIGNGNDVPKFIQQMALYPTPLSDTDCTTLTTL